MNRLLQIAFLNSLRNMLFLPTYNSNLDKPCLKCPFENTNTVLLVGFILRIRILDNQNSSWFKGQHKNTNRQQLRNLPNPS